MNIKRSAALIMIAVLLLCGLSGCKDGQGFDSDTPSVTIIIKGSESDFWNDVKKGALSAATVTGASFPEACRAASKAAAKHVSGG